MAEAFGGNITGIANTRGLSWRRWAVMPDPLNAESVMGRIVGTATPLYSVYCP
jgi:hypothetical protein